MTHSKVFASDFGSGLSDGMRCDVDGNVWCTMGWDETKEDGVRCHSPAGELLGKIQVPETCANLVFGGRLRNRLYICARYVRLCVLPGHTGCGERVSHTLLPFRRKVLGESAGLTAAPANGPFRTQVRPLVRLPPVTQQP